MNIISLNQLIKLFGDYTDNHLILNDFGYGQTSDISTTRNMKFPYLWITHSNTSRIVVRNSHNLLEVSLTFLIMDQINNQTNVSGDNGFNSNNQQEVISDTLQIAQDLVRFITRDLTKFGIRYDPETDVTLSNVFDETTDKATGWMVEVDLGLVQSHCVTPTGDVTLTIPPNK